MLQTAGHWTESRQTAQERRTAEREPSRRSGRHGPAAVLALQAVLAGAEVGRLPPELLRQMAGELGNSAFLALLSRQRLGRPETLERPESSSPLEAAPTPVEPAVPELVQPPVGFGGGGE